MFISGLYDVQCWLEPSDLAEDIRTAQSEDLAVIKGDSLDVFWEKGRVGGCELPGMSRFSSVLFFAQGFLTCDK